MKKSSMILIFKKRFLMLTLGAFIIIFLTFTFITINRHNGTTVFGEFSNPKTPIQLSRNGIEPEIPQDIDDLPFYNPSMPSKIVSISEVILKGRELPLDFIYNDLKWKRKAYMEYWHSKYQRWSYVPNRLHFAMHRLFTTYPTASVYYDFIHDLGIAEESTKFKGYLPTPPKDKSQKVNPFEKIETVIMQTDVKKIITYGNQIVLIGKPRRSGLQALVIQVNTLSPFIAEENMLFQLATVEGDEIDYNVISLVKFD